MFSKAGVRVVTITGVLSMFLMLSGVFDISAQDPVFQLGVQDLGMDYDDGTQAIALDAGGTSPDSYLRVGSGFDQLRFDPFDRITFEFPSSSTLDTAFEVNTISEGQTFVVTKGGTLAWRVKRGSEGADILCSKSDFYGDNLLYELSRCPDDVAALPLTVYQQAARIAELESQVSELTHMLNSMRTELDALKAER